MSANEAIKLLQGEELHNDKNHRADGQASDAIGFCFAVLNLLDPELIYEHALYLSGVTSMNVCLIGEVKSPGKWTDSEARFSSGMKPEFSIEDYSLADFTEWEMYTPELNEGVQLFAPISSNWHTPVFAAKGGDSLPKPNIGQTIRKGL
jgi:hypothetical protein